MMSVSLFQKKWFRISLLLGLLGLTSCTTPRPPALIPFSDGEYWALGSELVFTIRETGQRIIVPRGFVTDFASVPRVFWTIFPKHGEYTRAAIVHDYLYWKQQCSREQADELFDIVMEDSEVDTTSRYAIYAAVRVWGDDAWEGNSEAKEAGYLRIIPERYMNFPIKTRWEDYREFLRKMHDETERQEEFPLGQPPSYCRALEEKETPADTPVVESSDDKKDDEEEKDDPKPLELPIPESAIGA